MDMHVYDPSDSVVYVHMVRDDAPYASAVMSTSTQSRLPRGYANKSLRTRLTGSAD